MPFLAYLTMGCEVLRSQNGLSQTASNINLHITIEKYLVTGTYPG